MEEPVSQNIKEPTKPSKKPKNQILATQFIISFELKPQTLPLNLALFLSDCLMSMSLINRSSTIIFTVVFFRRVGEGVGQRQLRLCWVG